MDSAPESRPEASAAAVTSCTAMWRRSRGPGSFSRASAPSRNADFELHAGVPGDLLEKERKENRNSKNEKKRKKQKDGRRNRDKRNKKRETKENEGDERERETDKFRVGHGQAKKKRPTVTTLPDMCKAHGIHISSPFFL